MSTSSENHPPATAQVESGASEEGAAGEKPTAAGRKQRGRVFIDIERCKGCGLCITFCPSHVLERSEKFNSRGYHPPKDVKAEDCTGCDICGYFCPDFAIHGVRIDSKKKDSKDKKDTKNDEKS